MLRHNTYSLKKNDDNLSCVINCKSAYEVWNDLIITHEGTSQVKRSKINLLRSQYDNFYMLESESINEMLTRFTKITSRLPFLRWYHRQRPKDKVIKALLKFWEVKATTLKELNNREEMNFSGFIRNLKTNEMEMKVREEREPLKKKAIAFRASLSISEEDSIDENEKNFAMLLRKVGKMF